MKIKTEEGIAEPMPLSDLQENNRLLKLLIAMIGVPVVVLTIIIIALIIYIFMVGAVNNIVSDLVHAIERLR